MADLITWLALDDAETWVRGALLVGAFQAGMWWQRRLTRNGA